MVPTQRAAAMRRMRVRRRSGMVVNDHDSLRLCQRLGQRLPAATTWLAEPGPRRCDHACSARGREHRRPRRGRHRLQRPPTPRTGHARTLAWQASTAFQPVYERRRPGRTAKGLVQYAAQQGPADLDREARDPGGEIGTRGPERLRGGRRRCYSSWRKPDTRSPIACVLGHTPLRGRSTRPIPTSMVLPRDSILPFLNGPLLAQPAHLRRTRASSCRCRASRLRS